MLLIPEDQVQQLLDPLELRTEMETALIELSAGRVIQPVREVVRIDQHDGWLGLMPAVYRDVIGVKLVTVFPRNANCGSHTHNAAIELFCSKTGEPLATLGGRIITALRTAAISAIATRELANRAARVLAIFGSGVQARTHYEALKLVRSFNDVRVWSRTAEHAKKFADEIGGRSTTPEEAAHGADVVVTVTNSPEPVLRGAWLKHGAHVNAVGAVGATRHEIDAAAMQGAAVVVESRESALRESGDIIQSGAQIYAELGELLAGTKPKPKAKWTIYKSLGVAVEDVAAAKLVYEKVQRQIAAKQL